MALKTNSFSIALAQCNFILGDLSKNATKIFEQAQLANLQGAKLLITPELSLTGYPPEDLLFRESFIQSVEMELNLLAEKLKQFEDLTVLVGHPKNGTTSSDIPSLYNCVSVIRHGEIISSYAKQKLPNTEVFDEVRYFTPGIKLVFSISMA